MDNFMVKTISPYVEVCYLGFMACSMVDINSVCYLGFMACSMVDIISAQCSTPRSLSGSLQSLLSLPAGLMK